MPGPKSISRSSSEKPALIQINAGFRVARRLQGTQKVENVLLLAILERIEVPDDCVRFRCVKGKETPAAMRLDCLAQVRRSSIMQEE